MRSFIALTVREKLRSEIEALTMGLDVGNMVPPENYHVTLAFLDDQPETVLMALHDELTLVSEVPIYTQLIGVDVIGGDQPRLLVADVQMTERLGQLRDVIHRACRDVGIVLKKRKYRPHITLSRLPSRLSNSENHRLAEFLGACGSWQSEPLAFDQFAVYRSTLSPEGAVYTPLAEYALAGHY